MTETNHGGTVRTGSLLSLVPNQEQPPKAIGSDRAEPRDAAVPPRRLSKPSPSPMLSALAHAPEPVADRPAPVTEESKPAKGAHMARSPAASDEDTPVPTPTEAASPVALESTSNENSSATDVVPERLQPETANGLVARLRRQFMDGLPEGREEERRGGEEREEVPGSPIEPTASQPAAETRRSALEEVRFRLREFRAELLARAGRG